MGEEGDEGDEYDQSIHSQKEQLEGLGWKVVLLELREGDRVEKDYPHDVDKK